MQIDIYKKILMIIYITVLIIYLIKYIYYIFKDNKNNINKIEKELLNLILTAEKMQIDGSKKFDFVFKEIKKKTNLNDNLLKDLINGIVDKLNTFKRS